MPMPAKKPATTPIPVHASEPELNPFILTHLSIPRFEAVLLDVKLATTSGRSHYLKLRRGGYPLGSGGIESANKFICHTRLKRSGAWWYAINCNQMLALRCAKYNGTFDQVFVRHQARLRAA